MGMGMGMGMDGWMCRGSESVVSVRAEGERGLKMRMRMVMGWGDD